MIRSFILSGFLASLCWVTHVNCAHSQKKSNWFLGGAFSAGPTHLNALLIGAVDKVVNITALQKKLSDAINPFIDPLKAGAFVLGLGLVYRSRSSFVSLATLVLTARAIRAVNTSFEKTFGWKTDEERLRELETSKQKLENIKKGNEQLMRKGVDS